MSWPKPDARWPQYLPFPSPIRRTKGWVPNRQSVDWPQSQFAPLYLRPGSASFQPYRYPAPGPYSEIMPEPPEMLPMLGPVQPHRFSPSGDIDRLPPSLSGVNMSIARRNQGTDAVVADLLSVPSASPVAASQVIGIEELDATLASMPVELIGADLTAGLKDKTVNKIKKLEGHIARLSESPSDRAAAVCSRLVRVHKLVRHKLERRAAGEEVRLGWRLGAAKRRLQLAKARRLAEKTANSDLVPEHSRSAQSVRDRVRESDALAQLGPEKQERVDRIKAEYAAGAIDKAQATYLIGQILRDVKPGDAHAQAKSRGRLW